MPINAGQRVHLAQAQALRRKLIAELGTPKRDREVAGKEVDADGR